ncbi:PepSY domain-containing protein [Streptomyces sp. NPDC090132]|uniref:PepSY domain-containing protein n=1 Tax=Streptomyces sp. NPDC090132 TaxID=3365955 RepID=UPI00380DA138
MTYDPRPKNTGFLRAHRLRAAGAACVVLTAALLTGCGQDSGSTSTGTETSEAARAVPERTTSPSPSPSASLTEDQQKRKKLLASTKITFDKAVTTAEGAVKGGKVTELDLKGPGKSDDDTDASASASASASTSASASMSASPTGASSSPSGSSASPSASPTATGPEWVAAVVAKDGTEHTVRIDAVTGKVLQSVEDPDQDTQEKSRTAERIAKATQTPQEAAKAATDKAKGTVTSLDLDENDKNVLVWSVDVVAKDYKETTVDIDAASGSVTGEHVDND